MSQEVTNFARFYAALKRLPNVWDAEETKKTLVGQYTGGRTEHIHEMTRAEYTALCEAVEEMNGYRAELRKQRSVALKLLQQIGVDTTDWAQINDFMRHPRISGKAFGQLRLEELEAVETKLRSIKRKGWKREPKKEQSAQPCTTAQAYMIIDFGDLAGLPQA